MPPPQIMLLSNLKMFFFPTVYIKLINSTFILSLLLSPILQIVETFGFHSKDSDLLFCSASAIGYAVQK